LTHGQLDHTCVQHPDQFDCCDALVGPLRGRERRTDRAGDPVPGSTIGIALQAVAFALIIVASALTPAPAVARDGGSTSAGRCRR
jgi:hypothetical protein